MKNFVIAFFIIFSALQAQAANNCALNDIAIGASYSDVKSKYKITTDGGLASSKYFTVQARGSNFCDKMLPQTEVKLLFIENKLAQITFSNFDDKQSILESVKKSFGESNAKNIANKYGKEDMINWSFDNKKVVFAKRKTAPFEVFNITGIEFDEELVSQSQNGE
jgi:hypothetical protein